MDAIKLRSTSENDGLLTESDKINGPVLEISCVELSR